METQVLQPAQAVIHAGVLKDNSDGLSDQRLLRHDIIPVDERSAGGGLDDGDEDVDGGGFPRAVRTEESK